MDSTPNSDIEEETNRWIDPRRPLTATSRVSGGLAGGEIIRPRGGKIRGSASPSAMIDLSGGVRGDRPYFRYGNLQRHNFPTAMTDGSGGVGGSGKISPSPSSTAMTDRSDGGDGRGKISPSHSSTAMIDGSGGVVGSVKISPSHSSTAMTDGSGGVGGGSSISSLPIAKPTMTRFIYRHLPIGNTSTDPYWIRGGLQKLTTVHYVPNGVAGGVDGAKGDDWPDSISDLSPMSTFPFKVSTESWAAAEAEADQWMIDQGLMRSNLSYSFIYLLILI